MRDPQYEPTNDPAELAAHTREQLIAERYINEAFAATPAMWDERFRNLDAQILHARRTAEVKALTDQITGDDQWTVQACPGTYTDQWYVVPPVNNPNAHLPNFPIGTAFHFTVRPDGIRVIVVTGRTNALNIADRANRKKTA